MTSQVLESTQLKKELYIFLIITFAATFVFSFIIYLIAGMVTFPVSQVWFVTFQAYMLIPATSAIICMVYFKSQALTKETKIIFSLFLIYVGVYSFESYVGPVMGTIGLPLVAFHPTNATNIPILSMIVAIIGILTAIILNLKKGWRVNLESARLAVGENLRYYLIMALALTFIILITYLLNYISGLGVPGKEFNLNMFFAVFIPSLVLSFILLWPSYFGEEYGWRAYLQDRLFPLLGGYKGVLILGIIWGLWHIPLIIYGALFQGQPVLGICLMIINTIIMGIILSYTVLKTGSIWIAVILHMIPDTLYPTANLYIATSINPIFAFGTGLYGAAVMAVLALILLRSKVWKTIERVQ